MIRLLLTCCLALAAFLPLAEAQMRPPGYDRAVQIERERRNIPQLDRDSITIVDTVAIMDPVTSEESIQVITSVYSMRDYLTVFWQMGNPDILLDHQPHVILDPKTYEEITIRLTPDSKIEVNPKQE
jgi:hypothetical protein